MKAPFLPSLAVASFVIAAGTSAAPVTAPTEERVTRSAEGHVRDHAADELRDPTTFETTRRAPPDVVTKPRHTGAGASKGASTLKSMYGDSWVYDATTDVFADRDADGYFRFLRVRMDVDTVYAESWIYAEIYLSADGTAWEHLYSTQDFAIWGGDPDDDYEVETELVSGYPAGLYDVLIEIYDADTGLLVDEFGPNESPEFSLLPLEDATRDGLPPPPPPAVVIVEDGGGGAVSWLGLLGLLGAATLRRRRSTHS
jgi:MYXO-CTERM domain-containing protein